MKNSAYEQPLPFADNSQDMCCQDEKLIKHMSRALWNLCGDWYWELLTHLAEGTLSCCIHV